MTSDSVRDRRVQYETAGLDRADLRDDPIAQWHHWYGQAVEAGCVEPNAMVIATVDAEGAPDTRYVLARGVSAAGFEFYTNYESVKSRQLEANPHASAVFTWLQLHRQMRVRGRVPRLDAEASATYFASRPRASQIGAWASPQSEVLGDRAELDRRVAEIEQRFGDGAIPCPPFWGGWRLEPTTAEVWQGRPSRLHDRFRYRREAGAGPAAAWIIERLAP